MTPKYIGLFQLVVRTIWSRTLVYIHMMLPSFGFLTWRSLSILVQAPSQAFYEDTVEEVRGILRAADLTAYTPVWRLPVRFSAFGWEVASMPLPSAGGIVLGQSCGMLERLGIRLLAYDYRAEHVPTFDAELEALGAEVPLGLSALHQPKQPGARSPRRAADRSCHLASCESV